MRWQKEGPFFDDHSDCIASEKQLIFVSFHVVMEVQSLIRLLYCPLLILQEQAAAVAKGCKRKYPTRLHSIATVFATSALVMFSTCRESHFAC